MSNAQDRAENPSRKIAVSVLRVKPGESKIVRTLSDVYHGFLTHFLRGSSEPCYDAGTCHPKIHAKGVWKGYTAVQCWDAKVKKWQPMTLEISEHCELDFRGRLKRGQEWRVYRGTERDDSEPIFAEFIADCDLAQLPAEFDYMAPVKATYGRHELPPSLANPRPARVYAEASEGAPPQFIQQQVQAKVEQDRLRQAAMAEAREAAKMVPTRNGVHR